VKTIIVGIGNSLFSDDGVGLLVAQTLKSEYLDDQTTVIETLFGGLDILELITGFEKVIAIDAIKTGENKPGTIYRFDINQVQSPEKAYPHEINFITSLKLYRKLGWALPNEIIVFGIEVQNVDDLNQPCTSKVIAAIPACVEQIMNELRISTVGS